MKRGVPVGYKHNWAYHGHWAERKIAPGKWRVKFTATKRTSKRSGGPPAGFAILWGFRNMQQRAVKVAPGVYQTELTGIKYTKGVGRLKKRKVYKVRRYKKHTHRRY